MEVWKNRTWATGERGECGGLAGRYRVSGLPLVNPVPCVGRWVMCGGRGHGRAWGHPEIGLDDPT